MPATIVLAPAAGGKTAHCVAAVRERALARPLAPIWALLPDRIQGRYFSRRLAEAGGALGVRVATFRDLYRSVLDAAGMPVLEASPPVAFRLVRAAIADAAAGGHLDHYAPIAGLPGFAEGAAKAIGEIKTARVSPRRFLAECGADPRLRELGQVYSAYQARLVALGRADPEGLDWLAVELLEQAPESAADLSLVVVDGFDEFDPVRRDTLAALSHSKADLIVTLPGGPDFARPAHRRFKRSFESLTAHLNVDGVTVPAHVSSLRAALGQVEHALFEPARVSPTEPEQANAGEARPIGFVELASPAEEAREALRWVKARHVRDGVRLSDCLIVTPEPERYHPLLREVATEFGLALEFTEGEPLITTPAATALADLLDLPRLDYPHRLLADTLRSPYFRVPGFAAGDAETLEAVSRAAGITSGLDRWLAALDRLAASPAIVAGEVDDDQASAGVVLARASEAARLRASLAALADCLAAPEPRSGRDWVAWLEDRFERLGYAPVAGARDDAVARQDRAVFESLGEVLRALVVGDELERETRPEAVADADVQHEAFRRDLRRDYASFAGELRGLIETVRFRERPEKHRDHVLVTKVLDSRGPRFAAVTMLGLSEGLFPQVETEDLLLDEALRARLGLEPRLGREQRALFYLVATRADRWLRFSRPYMSERGEEWAASPYWNAALAALGPSASTVQRIRPDDPRALPDAASIAELLFWLVRRKDIPARLDEKAEIHDRLDKLRAAREVMRSRLEARPAGPHEGDLSALADVLAEWYGPDHVWSPSRLETYETCGLRFLVESLLELEDPAPPEPGPDARQLGTLLHAILEAAYRAADDPSDPDAVIAALRPIAAEQFAAAPQAHGFEPTAYWQVEQAQWTLQLELAVRGLAEPPGQWRPVGFEVPFGLKDAPALVVETGDPAAGAVRLRGVIDRVDRNGDGNLRVIDYKTGSSHLSATDLISGRRLQIPLYALAAEHRPRLEAMEEAGGRTVEGIYWAIRAGKPGSLTLSGFRGEHGGIAYEGPEGAIDLVRRHVADVVAGVRSGAFEPEPPAGGCPAYCAARGWCWRYVPGRNHR